MKNLLAIDTTTNQASVAISINGKLLSKENTNIKQHAEYLLPMISELFTETGTSFAELQGIVFGCGPGSFTGIRVSCSVAKALAYAHNLPMYPVTSLHAIAYAACDGNLVVDTSVLAMLDARMQEFYWQYFSDLQIGCPEVSSVEDIKIPEVRKLIIAGPSINSYIDGLPKHILDADFILKDVFPTAVSMLSLVQEGYIGSVSANDALPLYVRNEVVRGVKGG